MVDIKLNSEHDLEWVIKEIPPIREITSGELIKNGSFDDTSHWVADLDFTPQSNIVSGYAEIQFGFWQSFNIAENSKFKISFSASNIPNGESIIVAIIDGDSIVYDGISPSGYENTIWSEVGSENKTYSFEVDVTHGEVITILFNCVLFNFGWHLDNVSITSFVDIETSSDIDYDYSDFVNIVDLLEAKKGEIRQYPIAGADIKSFQMARYDQQKINSIIKETLLLDKWKTDSVIVKVKDRENMEVFITPKRND